MYFLAKLIGPDTVIERLVQTEPNILDINPVDVAVYNFVFSPDVYPYYDANRLWGSNEHLGGWRQDDEGNYYFYFGPNNNHTIIMREVFMTKERVFLDEDSE